eukprot:3308213-Pleurochrysis_carterae.AAC.1
MYLPADVLVGYVAARWVPQQLFARLVVERMDARQHREECRAAMSQLLLIEKRMLLRLAVGDDGLRTQPQV